MLIASTGLCLGGISKATSWCILVFYYRCKHKNNSFQSCKLSLRPFLSLQDCSLAQASFRILPGLVAWELIFVHIVMVLMDNFFSNGLFTPGCENAMRIPRTALSQPSFSGLFKERPSSTQQVCVGHAPCAKKHECHLISALWYMQ